MPRHSFAKKYGYLLTTFALFVLSVVGHWMFAWSTYENEQKEHGQSAEVPGFINQTLRDTFENWQSEFLQLMWQVAGLAFLWHVGSPQSKEGDDRKEEKLDEILQLLSKEKAKKIIASLDKKYPKK